MSRKMLIVVGLIVLLLANLAVSAMAAQVEADAPAWSPSGTHPANGGMAIKLTPAIQTNGSCNVPGSSSCPPATPGG